MKESIVFLAIIVIAAILIIGGLLLINKTDETRTNTTFKLLGINFESKGDVGAAIVGLGVLLVLVVVVLYYLS